MSSASAVVLDPEAIAQLVASGMSGVGTEEQRERRSRKGATTGAAVSMPLLAALKQARERGMPLVTTAAVLSEQYRDRHNAALDAFLAANQHIEVVDTDRALAREVGSLLTAAGSGSEDHVDATVVASALRAPGPSVVVTSDRGDLTRLGGASGRPLTVIPV